MSFGKPYILNVDGCIHDGWLVFYLNKEYNLYYFKYLLESPTLKRQYKQIAAGGVVSNLNKEIILKLKIYITKHNNEQFKISNFLTLIDQKITLVSKKIETLKKYKDGVANRLLQSNKNADFIHLKNIVFYENKSKISAGESVNNGHYILYKSGQKNGFLNTYSHEGIFIIANDGGEAQFKLTNGKFSYTDHCICFRCKDDATTIVLGNYLQVISKKISYVGFTGTGLKNIDRQYLNMIHVPILEYKKIARIFVSIDRAISLMEMNQDILKKIKNSLLNLLFI